MTLSNCYCTLAELKPEYDHVSSDPTLERKITTASREIDRFTGDQFYQATEARRFSGRGRDFVPVSPYLNPDSMSKVEYVDDVDEDGVPDWEEIDLDDVETDGTQVRFRGTSGDYKFPWGERNIRITGTWGRETVPDQVREAAIKRAIELLTGVGRRESARSGALDDVRDFMLHTMSGGPVG